MEDGMGAAHKKLILAVDDRPEILHVVTDALKGHYKVYGLTSGEAALEFLHEHTPELFILDIEMPAMDGFELVEHIQHDKRHAKTPIIFLTRHTSPEYMGKALKFNIQDYIIKPPTYDAILAKADKYLK
jgi:chemosensory pili system protein ChpA (sensor histidine kinase/response regulator)